MTRKGGFRFYSTRIRSGPFSVTKAHRTSISDGARDFSWTKAGSKSWPSQLKEMEKQARQRVTSCLNSSPSVLLIKMDGGFRGRSCHSNLYLWVCVRSEIGTTDREQADHKASHIRRDRAAWFSNRGAVTWTASSLQTEIISTRKYITMNASKKAMLAIQVALSGPIYKLWYRRRGSSRFYEYVFASCVGNMSPESRPSPWRFI